MRTTQRARRIGLIAVCAVMALSFACEKKPSQQPQPTPAPGTTPAVQPTQAPVPTKGAVTPKPAVTGPKKTVRVPDPQAVNVADVALAVRVSRVDQVLPKVTSLAQAFVPTFKPEMIRDRIALALGDPALAGLDQSRSILFCLFAPQGSPAPGLAVLIPVNNDQYKTRFETMGSFVHQNPGGKTLIVTRDEAAAVAARKALGQLEELLRQPPKADLSVYVNVEMLMSRYNQQIDAGVKGMVQGVTSQMQAVGDQMPGGADAASVMVLEVLGILEFAKEVKDLELSASLTQAGPQLSLLLRARPGTALAKALEYPYVADMSALSFLPGTGAIVGCGGATDEAGIAWLGGVLDRAAAAVPANPNSKFDPKKMKDVWMMSMGRSQAAAFDVLSPTAGGGMSGLIVYKVQNPETFMSVVRNAQDIIDGVGMSSFMSMNVQFQENARTYKGVAIHKYSQTGEMPMAGMGMGQAEAAIMASLMQTILNQTAEIAAVGDYVVSAMGGSKIEPVIDAILARKPLSTGKVAAMAMVEEADLYIDIHPNRLIAYVLGRLKDAVPQANAGVPAIMAAQVEPITVTGSSGEGKAQFSAVIPLASVRQIRDVVMQATTGTPVAPVAP